MYQAIYKCRLCGENTISPIVDINDDGMSNEILNLFNKKQRESNSTFRPHVATTHHCLDGSVGVADFQGFKKVGD